MPGPIKVLAFLSFQVFAQSLAHCPTKTPQLWQRIRVMARMWCVFVAVYRHQQLLIFICIYIYILHINMYIYIYTVDLKVWESSWKGAANHTCANVSRSTCLPFSMGLEPKLYLALCREFKLQLAIQVLVNSKL